MDIRMDSHKLIYHPCVVSDWLKGKNTYPIEVEISPSGACNHKCIFCAVEYLGYEYKVIDKDVILKTFEDISKKGLKSVIMSGEGEPLLNKNISDIICGTKKLGIDDAMSTNGVLLTKELSGEILKCLTWVRFSISAAKEQTYKKIHRSKDGDLQKVYENLTEAVRTKRDNGLTVTLGAQLLLIDDNVHEARELAGILKEIGMDYISIKPYSQHPKSKNMLNTDYSKMLGLKDEITALQTETFRVFFRSHAMNKLTEKKPYKTCHGLPFMSHIDASGNVFPCIAFVGDADFSYGNLYEQSFTEIWEGDRRKKMTALFNDVDTNEKCRENCRLDEINRYLDALKNPGEHVNFI